MRPNRNGRCIPKGFKNVAGRPAQRSPRLMALNKSFAPAGRRNHKTMPSTHFSLHYHVICVQTVPAPLRGALRFNLVPGAALRLPLDIPRPRWGRCCSAPPERGQTKNSQGFAHACRPA